MPFRIVGNAGWNGWAGCCAAPQLDQILVAALVQCGSEGG